MTKVLTVILLMNLSFLSFSKSSPCNFSSDVANIYSYKLDKNCENLVVKFGITKPKTLDDTSKSYKFEVCSKKRKVEFDVSVETKKNHTPGKKIVSTKNSNYVNVSGDGSNLTFKPFGSGPRDHDCYINLFHFDSNNYSYFQSNYGLDEYNVTGTGQRQSRKRRYLKWGNDQEYSQNDDKISGELK